MTHEFKTPISTISLACEAMNDEGMMGQTINQTRPYVKMIDDENKRLGLLVERILQSAVLDRGIVELKCEKVELNSVLYDATENARLKIDSLLGRLDVYFPQTQFFVYADQMHLANCLSNLLDNAIKYSKGKPQVKVEMRIDKNLILVEVKDKGIGIKAEHINKIFDKLYRVPTGNVHNVKGFGLGLSYVKSIADLHGWTVTVKSVFGEGSTFLLSMALYEE
jgi:two-component system phosphate regulon sensor histidine kinase PhoR